MRLLEYIDKRTMSATETAILAERAGKKQVVFSRHSSVCNKSTVLVIYRQTGGQELLLFLLSV